MYTIITMRCVYVRVCEWNVYWLIHNISIFENHKKTRHYFVYRVNNYACAAVIFLMNSEYISSKQTDTEKLQCNLNNLINYSFVIVRTKTWQVGFLPEQTFFNEQNRTAKKFN